MKVEEVAAWASLIAKKHAGDSSFSGADLLKAIAVEIERDEARKKAEAEALAVLAPGRYRAWYDGEWKFARLADDSAT